MSNIIGTVTTSNEPSEQVFLKAKKIAKRWAIKFEPRKKRAISKMLNTFNTDIFVVTANQIKVYSGNGHEPFFFHPNAAMFRAKRWCRGGEDRFISACSLKKGDIVVDATVGLASDAQLASLAVGNQGKVIGLEYSPVISLIITEGLKNYNSSFEPLNHAMKRIEIIRSYNKTWLENQPKNSVDIVYFDPMFEEKLTKSNGIQPIRPYSHYEAISASIISQAKRVARKKIVLKDHFRSHRFQSLGFSVNASNSSTYQFGVIEIEKSE